MRTRKEIHDSVHRNKREFFGRSFRAPLLVLVNSLLNARSTGGHDRRRSEAHHLRTAWFGLRAQEWLRRSNLNYWKNKFGGRKSQRER